MRSKPYLQVAGLTRLELATSGVTGRRSNQLNYDPAVVLLNGRRNRARTCDPRLVRPVLSQLSYPPSRSFSMNCYNSPIRGEEYINEHHLCQEILFAGKLALKY